MSEYKRKIHNDIENSTQKEIARLEQCIIASNNSGLWIEMKIIDPKNQENFFREIFSFKRKRLISIATESLKFFQDENLRRESSDVVLYICPNFGDTTLFPIQKQPISLLARLLLTCKEVKIVRNSDIKNKNTP